MINSRKTFSKSFAFCVFLFLLFFLAGQANYAFAMEGGSCPKNKIQLQFWCETCKEIREFKDCDTADYIWDFEKYKAGSEEYADAKAHQDLPEAWGCQRIKFSCVNKDCEAYGRCIPHPGICEVCMDDMTSEKVWAKIDFKCTGCGKTFDQPGEGHKINERIEYVPTLLDQEAGKCKECGKPLETVCRKSGTCPHIPSY